MGCATTAPVAIVAGVVPSYVSAPRTRADGVFNRDLRIAAERVQIGGEIRQPVHVVAERLEILPSARVLGALTYEGTTPATIATGAVVAQPMTYRNIGADRVREARWPRGVSSVVFGVNLFVGGMLLLLLLPRFARRPAEVLGEQPAQSLVVGLAALVTVPFVALLLVISLVGLPAGLALGAVYAAALFVGLVTTALFVGHVEARVMKLAPNTTRGRQVLLLLAGVVTLALLRSLPVVGPLIVFAAVVIGLGAVGMWTYRTYTGLPAAV